MTSVYVVPTHRLANKIHQTDSCVTCYRIYTCSPQRNILARGSIEDISNNPNADSLKRGSLSSNSSFGSVNIRELVGPDEVEHFNPVLKIGSIRTDFSELEVSVCYRSETKSPSSLQRLPKTDTYSGIFVEDCLTAAKQLLAGNEFHRTDRHRIEKESSKNHSDENLNIIEQPLRPAFASITRSKDSQNNNDGLIESAFDSLLVMKQTSKEDLDKADIDGLEKKNENVPSCLNGQTTNTQSEPIQVPDSPSMKKQLQDLCHITPGSTPKSLTDSFVFVDLNPPFASEEQNDINSFFHGPAPNFSVGVDSVKNVDELTKRLAVIEASVDQIDEFVDQVCVSEDEDKE